MKILIIGTYLPRKCGIATFTHDLYSSISSQENQVDIIAILDRTENAFPQEVKKTISRDVKEDYANAAVWANHQQYDCCIIQHEFGIFGGEAGNYILEFIFNLKVPLISNLHTILQNPSLEEYSVIQKVTDHSKKITAMTARAIDMLKNVYHVNADKLEVIPHGVPDFKLSNKEAKIRLGLEGKKVMLSFGLLGRNKGYEVAIKATSKVTDENFVYIILGATHPNVFKIEGDHYKNSLMQQAGQLNLSGKVFFVDSFVSDAMLQIYLKACDLYVTPYPNENQMSSGTLSFAIGAGAAVLSTPYWYAKDLLSEERGCLFDFNDADGLADIINNLLHNPTLLQKYRNNALAFGKSMSWKNVGKQHIKLISSIIENRLNSVFNQKSKTIIKYLAPGKTNKLISQ